MKNKILYLAVLGIIGFEIFSLYKPSTARSAALGNTKDTLQTSRISFAGRVKTPTAAGSAHVWIYTTGGSCASGTTTCNSTDAAALRTGDSIKIGTNTYTVETIVDNDEFTLTSNVQSGDDTDGTAIFFFSKPQHVISFTTGSAVADGFFRVLLPASASNFNDGVPDVSGFDFNTTVDVTATNATGYTFSNNAATPSGGTNCPANYHCFEFHYSGAGGNGTAITLTIGNTNGTNTPIAPAPTNTHVPGQADNYVFIVQNFTNGANPTSATPTDTTSGKSAFIEAVRVTATVDPSISLTINGVGSGVSACGITTTVSTNNGIGYNLSNAVPFGTLSLNTFSNAAHILQVSTNAQYGYTVTTVENDQLGRDGGTSPFIPDTSCGSTPCTHLSNQDWNVALGYPGFGYSLAAITGATVPFTAGVNFSAKQFPAAIESEAPQLIMSNSGVANGDQIYVCYRISVDATQAAGNYENQITYTATASF